MQKTSGVSGLNAQLKTARTGLLPRASFGHVNDRFAIREQQPNAVRTVRAFGGDDIGSLSGGTGRG